MVGRVAACVIGLSLLWSSPSLAQSESQCPSDELDVDDLVVTPPGKDAPTVARNTLIRIDVLAAQNPTFGLLRVPLDSPVDTPVPATWQRVGETDRFVVRPNELLEPMTKYRVVVGIDTLPKRELTFVTSDLVDTQPPQFNFGQDRVTRFSSIECGDEGRRRVTLEFDRATDDGDQGSIEYLLYLTRASGLDAPRLMARQYLALGSESMSFALEPEQLATPVCVVVDAVDGVGNHAEGIDEFCFDPLQGSFFEPCSVARRSRPWHAGFLAWLLAASLALRVRSRRLRAAVDGRATLT